MGNASMKWCEVVIIMALVSLPTNVVVPLRGLEMIAAPLYALKLAFIEEIVQGPIPALVR